MKSLVIVGFVLAMSGTALAQSSPLVDQALLRDLEKDTAITPAEKAETARIHAAIAVWQEKIDAAYTPEQKFSLLDSAWGKSFDPALSFSEHLFWEEAWRNEYAKETSAAAPPPTMTPGRHWTCIHSGSMTDCDEDPQMNYK